MKKNEISTHYAVLYTPKGESIKIGECLPERKTKIKGYCKYCYTTHSNWWQMKKEDYNGEDVLLCGNCEHTSWKYIV